jgi:hypothetical protein
MNSMNNLPPGVEAWQIPGNRPDGAKRGCSLSREPHCSAKDQFEYSIRNMIEREMRRRKTGRIHVLHHVVRVVNELNTLPDHHWRMVPNDKHEARP